MGEKLIIKNFGPINEAEFDFKKFNILIGEQGTGKSAIAKLVYVISSYFFLFGTEDERPVILKSYGLFFKPDTKVEYETDFYKVLLFEGNFFVNLKENTKKGYEDRKQKPNAIIINWFDNEIGDYKYIPAERIALTPIIKMLNAPSRTLYRGSFDEFIIDFANDYDEARKNITHYTVPHLNKTVFKMVNGVERIFFNDDELFLDQTSSGFQASIPLVIFLEYYTRLKAINKFIIEEPELNLFPSAQNELLNFFADKINKSHSQLLLNTHSPYVLSSINNLLYAFKVGQTNEDAVNEIIPKNQWLDPAQFTAYKLLPDGTAKNIVDDELQEIMVEELDGAGKDINALYDRILDIKFKSNEKSKRLSQLQ